MGSPSDRAGHEASARGIPQSFRPFSDRSALDLEAFEWNSSMDLLACLTAPPDSTMSIYRLLAEDQSPKLLSEKITGIGTALAWSPCGRKIAVGDRLGGVAVYDGECGTMLHVRRPHARPVAALSWTDGGNAASVEDPSWSRMLPPLLTVPSSASNMYAETHDAETAEQGSSDFSLLISIDDSGLVVVSANGTFTLQACQLFERPTPQQFESPVHPSAGADGAGIVAAAVTWPDGLLRDRPGPEALATRKPKAVRLSPDFRCLAVLLGARGSASAALSGTCSAASTPQPTPGTPLGAPSPPRTPAGLGKQAMGLDRVGQYAAGHEDGVVLVLDVRKLAIRRRELAQASRLAERLVAVVAYAQRGAETLAQVWRGAVEGFAAKMRSLAETVEAHSTQEDTSVHRELLQACCSGGPPDALHAFLAKQTSAQQLARLERSLLQALEYTNLVVCTRLQVAGQHMTTLLHELHACAGWAQKFKAIGLEPSSLRATMAKAQDFSRFSELLLIECCQARRFVRTLFQILLGMAHKVSEAAASEAGHAGGPGAPSREDLDDFMDRLQRCGSLELAEVTERIGACRSAAKALGGADSAKAPNAASSADVAASLVGVTHQLAADAEQVGKCISRALASQTTFLACIPVHAPSPWASVAVPDLRNVANSDVVAGLPSPRGLGHSTLSLAWEASEGSLGTSRLLILWSGGGGRESELHLCRVHLPPSPPGAPRSALLERTRLNAGGLFAQPEPGLGPSHFLLCEVYGAGQVAALILQERSGGAHASVCLVDISSCRFDVVADVDVAGAQPGLLPAAVNVNNLPEGAARRSAPLPDCYVWASSLRTMAARGVCSVYACRARRLLTLDMEVDDDDDDREDGE